MKNTCSKASIGVSAAHGAQVRDSLISIRQSIAVVLAQVSLSGTCTASGPKGLSRDSSVYAEAADHESHQNKKETHGLSPGKQAQQGHALRWWCQCKQVTGEEAAAAQEVGNEQMDAGEVWKVGYTSRREGSF